MTNYLTRIATTFLLLCSLAFGQARAVSDSQTAVVTPTTLTFPDVISTSATTLEVIISGTAPNTISVVTSGCMRGGTCDTLDTYTTVANSVRKVQPLSVYDQYRVVISWTVGDATTNVKINRLSAVAKFGGVSGTGTANTLAMFSGTSTLANSPLSTNGSLLTSSQPLLLPAGTTANNSWQIGVLGATYGVHQGSGSYIFSANNSDIFTVNANAPVGLNINGTNLLQLGTVAFASLGTPVNAVMIYCSDCTIANPCAGAGTGAIAKRLNGVWVCN